MLNYHKKSKSYALPSRSKRPFQFRKEQSKKIKRRLTFLMIVLFVVYFVYLIFYSDVFAIKFVNVNGNDSIPNKEIQNLVWQSLEQRRWLILPGNNYFSLNENSLSANFNKKYTLDGLQIIKTGKNTLQINIQERPGQLVWQSNDRYYLIDVNGIIIRELPIKDLINPEIPKIVDLSNSYLNVRDQVIDRGYVNLIFETVKNFGNYDLDGLTISEFRVDSTMPSFLKISTKQGPEIHISNQLTLEKQFTKLKKSLKANKLNLQGVSYINLRIEDQVIYK